MTKESYLVRPVIDAEGTLVGIEPGILTTDSAFQETCQNLAQTRPGNIVALRVVHNSVPEDKPNEDNSQFLWIDGEILPGEELRKSFSDPSKSPQLSERVVIARTGTIFQAGKNDLIISSKPQV